MSILLYSINGCKITDSVTEPQVNTSIKILSPTSGEHLIADSSYKYKIKWSANYSTEFNLQYTIDTGKTWILIDKAVAEVDTPWIYPWVVPAMRPAGICRIRISDYYKPEIFATSEFFIGTPATTPTLSSPQNGAKNVDLSPTLSWNISSGAQSYRLQVSITNQFTTTIYDDSTLTGTSILVSGLSSSTSYYWRVRTQNIFGPSSYSSFWSFTTGAPPNAPTLLAPQNGAKDVDLSPTLSWNISSGAQSYRLQLSTDSLFNTMVNDDSTLTGQSLKVSGLSNSTPYYWRVRAWNTFGTSSYSSFWSFTTIGISKRK